MAQSMSLVGLDVHASQTHAAILDTATGELRGVKSADGAGARSWSSWQTLPGSGPRGL